MMHRLISVLLMMAGPACLVSAAPKAYDPLRVPDVRIVSQTFDVKDASRERTLPVRVYLPETRKPTPVILFSHGLGGSRDNNPYLGNHWAKRGYLVVFVQHPGSDESVWMDTSKLERMVSMKNAASLENYLARTKDIPAVIDALSAWNDESGHPLQGRLDLEHLGMSGHSFGAQTTQAVSGQSFLRGRSTCQEPRIDAAVMMSPAPPAAGSPESAFASIRIPCLLLTGTKDDSPIGNTSPEDRLKVYPFLSHAPAWQVVFKDATHMDFGERASRFRGKQDPRYHPAILALTTAFWDAELRNDRAALDWLNGKPSRSVLQAEDRWERNPLTGKSDP